MDLGTTAIRYRAFYAIVVILLPYLTGCLGCYFPIELQGEYVTQSTLVIGNEIKYSHINITEDSVPVWGQCYTRIGSNVILVQSEDEDTHCFRCFNLKLVSRNILQVITTDTENVIPKCYSNEVMVMASCPNDNDNRKPYTEITLYKTHNHAGDPVETEHCPFSDRYRLEYLSDDGYENVECASPADGNSELSELDSCPSGAQLNLKFKGCSFEDHDINFDCLGQWTGTDGQNYVALRNARGNDKLGPQYRCAVYSENSFSGEIKLTFSNDSTCSSISKKSSLTRSTRNREEILTLHPMPQKQWPDLNFCRFPSWMHGKWEHLDVRGEQLVFKDHASFKTFTMKCVRNHIPDRYLVLSRSQCGEETYQCIWITSRGPNVLEFEVGDLVQNATTLTDEICAKSHFSELRWMTESRQDIKSTPFNCPISGEYIGMIPDAQGICSKLVSDCKTRDLMYYEVAACDQADEIYEDRTYQCLGEWREGNLTYIYTKRKDIGMYECFVGLRSSIDPNKFYLEEAGENCNRYADPLKYGMEMHRVAHCNNIFDSNINPKHYPSLSTDDDSYLFDNRIPNSDSTGSSHNPHVHSAASSTVFFHSLSLNSLLLVIIYSYCRFLRSDHIV